MLIKFFLITFFLITNSTSLVVIGQPSLEHNFSINGYVPRSEDSLVLLNYIDGHGEEIKDTAFIVKDRFTFKGYIKEPTFALLTRGAARSFIVDQKSPLQVVLYIEPTEMKVNVDPKNFKKIQVFGSKTHKEMSALMSQKQNVLNKIDSLYDIRTNIYEKPLGPSKNDTLKQQKSIQAIYQQYLPLIHRIYEMDHDFIEGNRDSFYSLALLREYTNTKLWSKDTLTTLYSKLSPRVVNSESGLKIGTLITAMNKIEIGEICPNFRLIGRNGKNIEVSKYKDEIILLDFWASWCAPCREQTPDLVKLHNSYASKGLKIVSVSVDRDSLLWNKAIEKEGTGIWEQILLTSPENQQISEADKISLTEKLEINGFPTYLLIGRGSKILGKWNSIRDNSTDQGSLFEYIENLFL